MAFIRGPGWFQRLNMIPCYFLKSFRECTAVMAQILGLLKWTLDQISQLACFSNNTENSPGCSPRHLPLKSFLLLYTWLWIFTDSSTKPHLSLPLAHKAFTFPPTLTQPSVPLLPPPKCLPSLSVFAHLSRRKSKAHVHLKLMYREYIRREHTTAVSSVNEAEQKWRRYRSSDW